MVLKIGLLFSLLIVFSSCETNSSSQESNQKNPPSAKKLYINNCAICHGDDGKLCVSGAKDLTLSTLSPEDVQERIENGKNGMPPMKNRLESKENVSAVTEYVIRMRKEYARGTHNRR